MSILHQKPFNFLTNKQTNESILEGRKNKYKKLNIDLLREMTLIQNMRKKNDYFIFAKLQWNEILFLFSPTFRILANTL